MKRWRCIVCGYIHEGDSPPDCCPVCGAGPDDFEWLADSSSAPATASNDTRLAPARVVVLGAGIAGLTAVETVRTLSPDSEIVLLDAEPELPYYRLNLTRLLAGEIEASHLPVHEEAWYPERRILLRRGAVVSRIDPAAQSMILADGEAVPYDKLILAQGASAFRPPVAGANLPGVMVLRTKADALDIKTRAMKGGRCIFVGGGLLGLEASAALARQGATVSLLEASGWLLSRQLNASAGALMGDHARQAGIDMRTQVKVREIAGTQKAEAVILENGERLSADLVVFSAGVRPAIQLAREAGLKVGRGIVVDDFLASSHPAVFAAGDVAEHKGICYGIWEPAQRQGELAAGNAMGLVQPFAGLPMSNTLKVMSTKVFSIGTVNPPGAEFSTVEYKDGDDYASFTLQGGQMAGAILLGRMELSSAVKRAIEGHLAVPGDRILYAEQIMDFLRSL